MASDREFKQYIKKRQEEFNNSADRNAITPDQLMQLVLNKYRTMLEAGEWKLQSDDELKINALEAKIEKMMMEKPVKKTKSDGASKGTSTDNSGKQRMYPAWMLKEPTGSEKTTIKKGDKEYHWCKYHKRFVHHTNDNKQSH